jgi:hypothetical protein
MAYITGRQFGRDLCEALGLPAAGVVNIEIRCHVKEAVAIKLEVLHDSKHTPALLEAVEKLRAEVEVTEVS